MSNSHTIARVLTAEGRGAVAVVSVEGPHALDLVGQAFQPYRARTLRDSGPDYPRVGRFGGDEVVVIPGGSVFPGVEIHCHGGYAAVGAVLDTLRSLGILMAPSAEESWPPEVSGWAVRAQSLLPNSPTLRVAEILLDQAAGVLDHELREIRLLTDSQLAMALQRIEILLRNASCGLKMIKGWTVALAGRPNVGKSCLLNRLAGYGRSIVSDVAGTTRDVLSIKTAIDGWPVEFLDVAGLRSSEDDVESQGIARAREKLEIADLVIVVLDRSLPLTREDLQVIQTYPQALRIANKSDLTSAWEACDHNAMAVSAEVGTGITELCQAVVRRLIPTLPESGAAVPFDAEIVERLHVLRARIRQVGPGEPTAIDDGI